MRELFFFRGSLALCFVLGFSFFSASAGTFPKLISLPDGFRPEGVAVGHGHQIYAGSLGTGAIYRADLQTGMGEIVVPPQVDRVAVGLSFDERSNFLFVAGHMAGAGYVYDVETGATVATYQFTPELNTFINDVVVTRTAAYFTDSLRPFLYRVPLGPQGELPAPSGVEEIALGGDFVFYPIGLNTNGIDATPDGKWLVIDNLTGGELYQVDPLTGEAY